MPHQEIIAEILRKRQPLAQRITEVCQNIKRILQFINELQKQSQVIISEENWLQNNPKFNPGNFASLSQRLENELARLSKLQARFARKTLNIGVVGRAGQGKSTFLQKITGLTTAEIPDGSGDHCTGVRSTICHKDNIETYAEVYFHKETSFLSEVIALYYQKLHLGSTPQSLDEFANLPLPTLVSEDAESQAMYQHLQKYHVNFHKYARLLTESSPLRIEKNQIREYVAQYSVQEDRYYFNYLAVKEVKIFCSFPNTEVEKIAVIDQPGLGDTGVGDAERLMEVVGQDVDVVVFVRMPAAVGQRGWYREDVQLYDIVRESLIELPINLWSFMVLNLLQDGSNLEKCNLLSNTIQEQHIDVVRCITANCSDPRKANQVLAQVLDYLIDNITKLDQQYATSCQRSLLQLHKDIHEELQGLTCVLQSTGTQRLFTKSFNTLWQQLTHELERLLAQVRSHRDSEDSKFRTQVETALENCRQDTAIPDTVEEIQLISDRDGSYTAAYCTLLARIRTHLSAQLLYLDGEMQESIDEFKGKIANLLQSVGLVGLSMEQGVDFLSAITNELPQDLHNLYSGFYNLNQYNVSYAGIIQKSLRQYLDELNPDNNPLAFASSLGYDDLLALVEQYAPEHLDTIIQKYPSYEELKRYAQQLVRERGTTLTLEQERDLFIPQVEMNPELLLQRLQDMHTVVVDKCEQSLIKLLREPNQIIYSMVAEFVDRILRAQGVQDEWRIFLEAENIRSQVWSEFNTLDRLMQKQENWLKLVQDAQKANQVESLKFLVLA